MREHFAKTYVHIIVAALSALVCAQSSVADEYNANNGPDASFTLGNTFFVESPRWYFLQKRALEDDILLFRKYAISIIDGQVRTELDKVKNIVDYGCQRTRKHPDYLVFHFPEWIRLNGIKRDEWIPHMGIHVALDQLKHTFTADGEFKNGSLFVDFDDATSESLMRLLVSEDTSIQFGPKSERLVILQKAIAPDGKGDIMSFIRLPLLDPLRTSLRIGIVLR
jgi:hypothetical protein